jgi:signal transduction histidine kinase
MLQSFLNSHAVLLLVSPFGNSEAREMPELMPSARLLASTPDADLQSIVSKCRPDAVILFGYEKPDVARAIDDQVISALNKMNIPFLFAALPSDSETIEKGINAGFTDYLPLPLNETSTRKKISNYIALRRSLSTVQKQNGFLKDINNHKNILFTLGSHDIKNSLKIINGFSKLIEEKHETLSMDDIAEFAKDIREASEIIQNIISDIIDIYMYETQSCEIFNEQIEVRELVERSCETFETSAYQKNIRFRIQSVPGDLFVNSDFRKLKQMLDNLLSNAVKYSFFNQNINIMIDRYFDETLERNMLRISVINIGPIIPDDHKLLIFEKFKRFPVSADTADNSSGLGLAIVKALSLMLDIKVECTSSAERGTCFELSTVEFVKF